MIRYAGFFFAFASSTKIVVKNIKVNMIKNVKIFFQKQLGLDGRKPVEGREGKTVLHPKGQEPRVLLFHPSRHKLPDEALNDGLLLARWNRRRH